MDASTSRRRLLATLGTLGIAGCARRDGNRMVNDQLSKQPSEQPNSGSFSEGWRCYRGDFTRRGQTSNSVSPETPRIRATFEPTVSSTLPSVSSPVLTPSRIFYQVDRKLFAINRESFEREWEQTIGSGSANGTLAVVDGTVYAWRHSIDAVTGEVNWEFNEANWGWGPIVTDSYIYLNGGTVVDRETGELLEERETTTFVPPAAYHDGVVYFESTYGAVGAYDVEAQEMIWSGPPEVDSSTSSRKTPAVDDTNVYHIIGPKLFAFDKTGDVQWSWGVNEYGTPVLVGSNRIFAGGGIDTGILVLDSDSGERVDEIDKSGDIIRTQDRIVGVTRKTAWAVDAQTYSEQWRLDLTQSIDSHTFHSPIVADGELYLCFNSGALAAFG